MEPIVAAYLVFRVASAWNSLTLVSKVPEGLKACTELLANSKIAAPPNHTTSHAIAFCSTDATFEAWAQAKAPK